jgi:hypothetical protein
MAVDAKKELLDLADSLYKACCHPEFIQHQAQDRYEFFFNKYKNFCQAYPVVAEHMVYWCKYNRNAFSQMLDNMAKKRGGIEEYCDVQSDYVKFLYIEEKKKERKHYCMKTANKLKAKKYSEMLHVMKRIQDIEREEKYNFKHEEKEILEEKKQELLDFINVVAPPQKKSTELDDLNMKELTAIYYKLLEYEQKLLAKLDEKNDIIDKLSCKDRSWVSHVEQFL